MTTNGQVLKRFILSDGGVGCGVSLITLGLYLSTLAPTVLYADSAEFQFVAWLPGIAHATGYPLYILLGWLWTHLFSYGEVAWRMNLLSAVFAAMAVGFVYKAGRQLLDLTLPQTPRLARQITAAGGALTFAITPTFWSQAIIAEVYTLHALFVVAVLGLALKVKREVCDLSSPSSRFLTFTYGLSLTHHRTMLLLLPALFFLFLPGRLPKKSKKIFSGKELILHILLLTVPLLLYLYIPLIASTTPYATIVLSPRQTLTLYDNSWSGFWHHVLGTVFSGDLQPTAAGLDRVKLAGQLFLEQFGWAGAVLAIAGFGTLILQQQGDLLWLTGISGLTFITFNLIYFIGDVFVLFIPVWLIVTLWLNIGSLSIAHWLAQNFVQSKASSSEVPIFGQMAQRVEAGIYRLVVVGLVTALFLGIVISLGIRNYQSQRNNTLAQARWQEILAQPLPHQAILLSNDRNEIMPLWYYQYVEQRRPDLQGLFPLIIPGPSYGDVGRVLEQALASRRPVYLIKPMAGLQLKADFQATGTLYQAVNHTPNLTHPLDITLPEITLANQRTESVRLRGYHLTPIQPHPGDELRLTLYWQTVQDLSIAYTSFVHLENAEGQGITQSDHQPGGEFYPSHYWQPDELLRDEHVLTIPTDIISGTYDIRVGMYYQPQPGQVEGMGSGEIIGQLTISP